MTDDMADDMADGPTLAELVTADPSTARVLERHGLDYCCGGRRSLRAACEERGIDAGSLLAELGELGAGPAPDWASMGPAELVEHLESTHHRYLHEELPLLSALAEKVVGVHGGRHPELAEVRGTYEELRADLEPHLMKEERVLFPMIRELVAAGETPELHCGSIANPIGVMLMEHDRAGELLAHLRRSTDTYRPPEDACNSYRVLYSRLAQLEGDVHLHVHKENNLLFPAVLALADPTAR
jgi:regulator of cell morphogenesis and NO signaling